MVSVIFQGKRHKVIMFASLEDATLSKLGLLHEKKTLPTEKVGKKKLEKLRPIKGYTLNVMYCGWNADWKFDRYKYFFLQNCTSIINCLKHFDPIYWVMQHLFPMYRTSSDREVDKSLDRQAIGHSICICLSDVYLKYCQTPFSHPSPCC